MKYLSLLLLLTCTTLAGNSQSTILQQPWYGEVQILGDGEVLRLQVLNDSLYIWFPEQGFDQEFLATDIQVGDGILEFNFVKKEQDWHFRGRVSEGKEIRGTLLQAGVIQHPFQLYAVQESPGFFEAEKYVGTYQLPTGGLILIWYEGGTLGIHSAISEKTGGLFALGEDRFITQTREQIQFLSMGEKKFQHLMWQQYDGSKIMAKRVPDFKFEDLDLQLSQGMVSGTLYLPPGEGPHPTCIIPMGAANYEQYIYELEARILSSYGIATYIYDNYGSGKSEGNLLSKTFQDKMEQAIEMYHALAEHPKVDQTKMGFRGGSQGGRIAAMAASRIPETAFVILLATPMETRMDQQLYAIAQYHRQRIYSEEEIALNLDIWRRYFTGSISGNMDSDLLQMILDQNLRHPDMILPDIVTGEIVPYYWQSDLTDRTLDYVTDINCPILCMFGSLDDRVPPQKSISQLVTALENTGKPMPEIITYDGANHSFMFPDFSNPAGLFLDQVRFIKRSIEVR